MDIEQLIADYLADPAKVAEADEWNDGTFDGEHYSAVERALADLDGVEPADLLGSDVLKRLYRLAKVHGQARRAKLAEMTETAIQRHADESEQMRLDQRDARRMEWAA